MSRSLESLRRRNRVRLARSFVSGSEPDGAVPTAAYIETTSRCNLDCPMCARQLADGSWADVDMSRGDFQTALASLAPECGLVLVFAGGEPLLHPDIAELIGAVTSSGRRTEMATNATLLDGRRSRDVLRAGLSTLVISLDAASPATYSKIRRGGDFERTCANVHQFLAWKRRLSAPTWVTVQMIALPENVGEQEAFKARWRRVPGVDAVRVKADEVHVERVRQRRFGEASPSGPCYFPWLGPLMIRYDGSVYPCCHGWRGEPVGHVSRSSTREIWNGAVMAALRAAHLTGRLDDFPACRECQAVTPHRALVLGALLVPPHVTRRAIPYVEGLNRHVGRWLIR